MTEELEKRLLTKEEFYKELSSFKYDLTWKLIQVLGIQTIVILGAGYFMLAHWKP